MIRFGGTIENNKPQQTTSISLDVRFLVNVRECEVVRPGETGVL